MKHFKIYALSLLLFLVLGVVAGHRTDLIKKANIKPVEFTVQQKATHRIAFVDENDNVLGVCTATAVAEDILMTAEHCIKDGSEYASLIRIDRSTRVYRLLAMGTDDRDHVILLLEDKPFVNTVQPDMSDAKVGDHVYIYGSGNAVYPPRKLEGVIADCADPSDVDLAQGQVCFTLPVIPGDSGSLVFDDQDRLVAIVTYKSKGLYSGVGFRVELGTFHLQAIPHKEKKKETNPLRNLF